MPVIDLGMFPVPPPQPFGSDNYELRMPGLLSISAPGVQLALLVLLKLP